MPDTVLSPSKAVKAEVKKIALLFNPQSGSKKGQEFAERTQRVLNLRGIEVIMIPLTHKGHAEEKCEAMDLSAVDVLCCLGGDGTFHECVNGMMKRKDDARERVPLAMIPAGTGNSFALEVYGSVELRTVLQRIVRGLHIPIDVSEITFSHKEREKIYLFNSLHWGMASKVLVTAEKLRWMGNAVRYTTAALVEIFKGHMTRATVKGVSPGGVEWEVTDDYSVCIANMIQTAAKGMKLAPDAKLNDGCIDILLIRTSNTFDLGKVFQKFYDGTHKDLDYVDYKQCRSFSITPLTEKGQVLDKPEDDKEQVLDIDGELKGIAPFHCNVLPGAIRVIV